MPRGVVPPKVMTNVDQCTTLLTTKQSQGRCSDLHPRKGLRKLRFDQGTIKILGDLCTLSALITETRFVGQGKDEILASIERFSSVRWVEWVRDQLVERCTRGSALADARLWDELR